MKSNIEKSNKEHVEVWNYFLEWLASKRIDFINDIYIHDI